MKTKNFFKIVFDESKYAHDENHPVYNCLGVTMYDIGYDHIAFIENDTFIAETSNENINWLRYTFDSFEVPYQIEVVDNEILKGTYDNIDPLYNGFNKNRDQYKIKHLSKDNILDKILAHGIESLTDVDYKILEK